jgi:hypothetical protein
MNECSFFDPDAEAIMKKKILPQVIKMLLKLGDGGGDRKMSFSECSCLSVIVEDLVASTLLDFVDMVMKILSLVECIDDKRIRVMSLVTVRAKIKIMMKMIVR